MAIINICGYEFGHRIECFNVGGTYDIQSTIKRTGNYAMRINPSGAGTGYSSHGMWSTTTGARTAFNLATVYITFYFYVGTLPALASEEFFRVIETGGTNIKMTLRVKSDGKIQAYAYDGITQLGSDSASSISTSTWYKISVKCGTGSSASYEVKVNDSTWLSGTGNLSTTNAGYIAFGKQTNRNSQTVDFYYDDLCIDNSEYPNYTGINLMRPDSDGTYTAWTASSGQKWDCVDDIPYNNTQYVESTLVSGDSYTANMISTSSAGIPSNAQIMGVLQLMGVKRSSTSNGAVRTRLRSGTTNSGTTSNYATTGTEYCIGIMFLTDPNTGSAWTLSALDNVEAGIVEYSTTYKSRMYGVYLNVAYKIANQNIVRNILFA